MDTVFKSHLFEGLLAVEVVLLIDLVQVFDFFAALIFLLEVT